jgi:AcrR family transcriptional regulator
LLTSSFQLFTEKGIDNTSVSEIAKNAKMAKGTFYLYFKDKYEIQNQLIAYHANRIFEYADEQIKCRMQQDAFHSLEDCIVFLVESIVDQLNDNPALLRFISKNLSWGIFSNIRLLDLNNQNCMDIFNSLLDAFPKKYRQKELMVYIIVELVNATCHNVILEERPVSLETLKPELFTAIRNILHQFEV